MSPADRALVQHFGAVVTAAPSPLSTPRTSVEAPFDGGELERKAALSRQRAPTRRRHDPGPEAISAEPGPALLPRQRRLWHHSRARGDAADAAAQPIARQVAESRRCLNRPGQEALLARDVGGGEMDWSSKMNSLEASGIGRTHERTKTAQASAK